MHRACFYDGLAGYCVAKRVIRLDKACGVRLMSVHSFRKDYRNKVMKVTNSLKTLKTRDRNCRVIRRRGRVYVINKMNPRFKARQG